MSIHPDPQINRLNVLGEPLASCCFDPITGYFRNGFCHTAVTDLGQHTVCAQMTSEFLNFSQKVGNDLITPLPEAGFPSTTTRRLLVHLCNSLGRSLSSWSSTSC